MYQPIEEPEPVLARELAGSTGSRNLSRCSSMALSKGTSASPGRGRAEPPFLAKYAGRILLSVVVAAVLISDVQNLSVPIDRVGKRGTQSLVVQKTDTVQFRIPKGSQPGGLVHILQHGTDEPVAVQLPANAVPGEMMSVNLPAASTKLSAVEKEDVIEREIDDIEKGDVEDAAEEVEFSLTHYILVIFVVIGGLYIIWLSAVGIFVGFGPLEVEPRAYMDHPARFFNPHIHELAEQAKSMPSQSAYATPRQSLAAEPSKKSALQNLDAIAVGVPAEAQAIEALREEGQKMQTKGGRRQSAGSLEGLRVAEAKKAQGRVGKASPRESPRDEKPSPRFSPRSQASSKDGTAAAYLQRDKVEAIREEQEERAPPRPREEDLHGFSGNQTIWEVWGRGKWLAGLMVLQSFSTTIFAPLEDVVRSQPVVAMFMMMLVGVGSNAGAQAVARAIQRITKEGYVPGQGAFWRQCEKEFPVSVWLALLLAWFACAIVWVGSGGASNAVAIAFSCGFIVMGSVLAGTALPYAFHRLQLDVIHSAALMQVLAGGWAMLVARAMCSLFLQTPDAAP